MTDAEMANANETAGDSKPERLPITVTKPTPYTFDLGNLLTTDPNPFPTPTSTTDKQSQNETLHATARDATQTLLNQLLTTCPITAHPVTGVLLNLPPPTTPLPRHKPLPTPKPPTKWELFARKKGIGKYSSKPGAALADKERRKKMVFDEASGEYVPRWGYGAKGNASGKGVQDDWLVEVDEKDWKKEDDAARKGSSIRGMGRAERKERIKRNERKMRANERRARS